MDNLLSNIDTILADNSDITSVLDEHEKYYLKNLISQYNNNLIELCERSDLLKESEVKLNLLNTIIHLIFKNSNSKEELIKNSFNNSDIKITQLLATTFELSKYIFDEKFKQNKLSDIRCLENVTMLGLLSEKTVELDSLLQERLKYINQLDIDLEYKNIEEKLDFLTSKFFILLSSHIATKKEVLFILNLESELDLLLEEAQNKLIDSDEQFIEFGLKVSASANIIYLLKEFFYYCRYGEFEDGNSFSSKLDTYIFNTIKIHEYLNDKEKVVKYTLLRFALIELFNLSIWSLADKSPTINKFIRSLTNEASEEIIFNLLPSQKKATKDLFSAKKSVVVTMPTSAGKTLIGELYILYKMHQYNVDGYPTVCYIVPTNALVNQVQSEFKEKFKSFDFNIEIALPYFDIDEIEDEILRNKPIHILITTPEKLDFLIRQDHPSLDNLKLVVLDEAHNIGSKDRGSKFELLLSAIKQKRNKVDFLLLSPFIKNAKNIAQWLGNDDSNSMDIQVQWTPNKQFISYGYFGNKGKEQKLVYLPSARNKIVDKPLELQFNNNPYSIKEIFGEKNLKQVHRTLVAVEHFYNIGNVLVLCDKPDTAEKYVKNLIEYNEKNSFLENISDDSDIKYAIDLIEKEDSGENLLIDGLKYGVVYHHARISNNIKDLIEILIKRGLVKVVFATTTLAQGMNFPIKSIVFDFLWWNKYGKHYIQHNEFWNIAGRAGRAFKDREGHVSILQMTNTIEENTLQKEVKSYIEKDIENLISSLESFFKEVNESTNINIELIRNSPGASNFLQYLNHLIKISTEYNFDRNFTQHIQSFLNNSLAYKEMTRGGFIEAQSKLRDFCDKYVNHLKQKEKKILSLADLSGLSDVSLSYMYAQIKDLKENCNADENKYLVSNVIGNKSIENLAPIIKIINNIPEIDLSIGTKGLRFDEKQIAEMVLEWIAGKSISTISNQLYQRNRAAKYEEFLALCKKYINGKMKTFVPWGMSVYQNITLDNVSENSKNIPSYIYYGVNNEEDVILSRIGVPRFALNNIKNNLKSNNVNLNIENIDHIKKNIKEIKSSEIDNITFKYIQNVR